MSTLQGTDRTVMPSRPFRADFKIDDSGKYHLEIVLEFILNSNWQRLLDASGAESYILKLAGVADV